MIENMKYTVKLEWDKKTGGDAYFNRNPVLKFDMAEEFGGEGRYYCSDEVFLAALSSCLLETFLFISRKLILSLKELYVTGESIIQYTRDGYYIRELLFKFEITGLKEQEEKLKECFELTTHYCHLMRALNPQIKTSFNYTIKTV